MIAPARPFAPILPGFRLGFQSLFLLGFSAGFLFCFASCLRLLQRLLHFLPLRIILLSFLQGFPLDVRTPLSELNVNGLG